MTSTGSFPLRLHLVDTTGQSIPGSAAVPNEFEVRIEYAVQGRGRNLRQRRAVWSVPRVNFQLPSGSPGGYFVSKDEAVPKRLRPRRAKRFELCCNDTYLNVYGSSDIVGVELSIGACGQVTLKSFLPVDQSAGLFSASQGHCLLATTQVQYGVKGMGCDKSAGKCTAPTLTDWRFVLQLTDFLFLQLPGTQFPYQVRFKQVEDGLYRLRLPTLAFTANGEPSPEQALGYSDGNLIGTYANVLPPGLRSTRADQHYLLRGTYNTGTGPAADAYAMLSFNLFGQVFIQCASSFDYNVFLPGSYVFPGVDVYYAPQGLGHEGCDRVVAVPPLATTPADFKFSDISQFAPFSGPALDGYRDSHVNDTYGDLFVKAYTSNEDQVDQTNGALDAYFSKSVLGPGGRIVRTMPSVRLTTNPASVIAWDTAVAIVRPKKRGHTSEKCKGDMDGEASECRDDPSHTTIVVTFALIDYSTPAVQASLYYCVSNDGGDSFGAPLLLFPSDPTAQAIGDARGVLADPHGGLWISINQTPLSSITTYNLIFYYSDDRARTWRKVLETTDSTDGPTAYHYDYPQIAYGPRGGGGGACGEPYDDGLWYVVDWVLNDGNEPAYQQKVGFIPRTEPCRAEQILVPYTVSQGMNLCTLAVDPKGRLYIIGVWMSLDASIALYSKAPGPLDAALFSPCGTVVDFLFTTAAGIVVSPFLFPNTYRIMSFQGVTAQTLQYDAHRGLLYALVLVRPDENSQNMVQYVLASPDAGRTWSAPVLVPGTDAQNRGFASIAFNREHRALLASWYDAQNSVGGTGVQYFQGVLEAGVLDRVRKGLGRMGE